MGNNEKTALVLFSGGVDSTYVAARSAPLFDRLVLNTYRTPGMLRVEASRKSSRQLASLFGEKIVHNIIDITDLVEKVRGGTGACVRDCFRYGFLYPWCLGCKLAMHLYTIGFCLREGLDIVLDGSNYYDKHALEQREEVKEFFSGLYGEKGITFSAPYYREKDIKPAEGPLAALLRDLALLKDSTEKRVAWLREHGIDPGKGVMSQYRGCQPSCSGSLFFNIPRTVLKRIFRENREKYLSYLKDKARP